MAEERSLPFVSVVVALRNEVGSIHRCLDALIAQDYPEGRYEIIVADGDSHDGSRDAVLAKAKEHATVRLIDNPQRATPFAFNAGIRVAQGDIVVIMGAHTYVERDFLRQSVSALERTGADVAGGVLEAVGDGTFGEAVAEAVTSPFGVGQVAFRMATSETFADTAANAAYRREVFERVGLFDEEFVRNQDDEINHRIRAAGGRIVVTPKVRMRYTARASPLRLWQQYYAYGHYKVRVFQKHPRMMRPRHFVPALSVAAGTAAVVGGVVNPYLRRWVAAPLATLYVVGVAVTSGRSARRIGWSRFPSLLAAYPILHFSYGTGFLVGLLRFFPRWWVAAPALPVLSPRPHRDA